MLSLRAALLCMRRGQGFCARPQSCLPPACIRVHATRDVRHLPCTYRICARRETKARHAPIGFVHGARFTQSTQLMQEKRRV